MKCNKFVAIFVCISSIQKITMSLQKSSLIGEKSPNLVTMVMSLQETNASILLFRLSLKITDFWFDEITSHIAINRDSYLAEGKWGQNGQLIRYCLFLSFICEEMSRLKWFEVEQFPQPIFPTLLALQSKKKLHNTFKLPLQVTTTLSITIATELEPSTSGWRGTCATTVLPILVNLASFSS